MKAKNPDEAEGEQRRFTRLRMCVNFRAGDLLPSCGARGAKELQPVLAEKLAERGNFLSLDPVHCMGKCHAGPTLKLLPGGPFLLGAQVADVGRLLDLLEAEAYDEAAAAFPDPARVGGA